VRPLSLAVAQRLVFAAFTPERLRTLEGELVDE
jgi:hypothetical protein